MNFDTNAIVDLVVYCSVLIFIISGSILNYLDETRNWNKGHCSRCYSQWKSFDMDSSGAVGYKCLCGKYIWISRTKILNSDRG